MVHNFLYKKSKESAKLLCWNIEFSYMIKIYMCNLVSVSKIFNGLCAAHSFFRSFFCSLLLLKFSVPMKWPWQKLYSYVWSARKMCARILIWEWVWFLLSNAMFSRCVDYYICLQAAQMKITMCVAYMWNSFASLFSLLCLVFDLLLNLRIYLSPKWQCVTMEYTQHFESEYFFLTLGNVWNIM